MLIRQCPKCRSTEIKFHAAGQTGNYECKKCGYIGPLIIEKDVIWKKKKSK